MYRSLGDVLDICQVMWMIPARFRANFYGMAIEVSLRNSSTRQTTHVTAVSVVIGYTLPREPFILGNVARSFSILEGRHIRPTFNQITS